MHLSRRHYMCQGNVFTRSLLCVSLDIISYALTGLIPACICWSHCILYITVYGGITVYVGSFLPHNSCSSLVTHNPIEVHMALCAFLYFGTPLCNRPTTTVTTFLPFSSSLFKAHRDIIWWRQLCRPCCQSPVLPVAVSMSIFFYF